MPVGASSLIVLHAGGALTAVAERIAGFSTLPFLKQRPAGGPEEVKRVLVGLYYDLGLHERFQRLTSLSRVMFGSDFPFTPTAGSDANLDGFRKLRGLSAL